MPAQPRVIGQAYKLAVAMYFREAGFPDATPARPGRKLSEVLRKPGDISGLPFTLSVSARRGHQLSTTLNEARIDGELSGQPFAAVLSRSGYPIERSYVLMELDQFAELIHRYDTDAKTGLD